MTFTLRGQITELETGRAVPGVLVTALDGRGDPDRAPRATSRPDGSFDLEGPTTTPAPPASPKPTCGHGEELGGGLTLIVTSRDGSMELHRSHFASGSSACRTRIMQIRLPRSALERAGCSAPLEFSMGRSIAAQADGRSVETMHRAKGTREFLPGGRRRHPYRA
jgi:hypothetical protein